jgi:hypothetical protein
MPIIYVSFSIVYLYIQHMLDQIAHTWHLPFLRRVSFMGCILSRNEDGFPPSTAWKLLDEAMDSALITLQSDVAYILLDDACGDAVLVDNRMSNHQH